MLILKLYAIESYVYESNIYMSLKALFLKALFVEKKLTFQKSWEIRFTADRHRFATLVIA